MFVTKKRFDRETKDLERSIENLRGAILCLQGHHQWGLGGGNKDPWIRCSRCYETHPEQKKQEPVF